MRSGRTVIVPFLRKKRVSSTMDSSWSRRSCASSSRPAASGKEGRRAEGVLGERLVADDLLGAAAAVAGAPREVRLVLDRLLQAQHAVDQCLGARGAAGDVDVHGHELVGGDERIVVEDAGGGAAGAHG